MRSFSMVCVLSLVLFFAFTAPATAQESIIYWPVSASTTPDTVDKPFGFRILCGACTDPNDADFHRGLDIKDSLGTPVHAVFNGTVVRVNSSSTVDPALPRWGKYVVIALDPMYRPGKPTLSQHKVAYLHLNSVSSGITVGADITRGQQIGTIGKTGNGINTVHLHLDYYQGSSDQWIRRAEARNPLEILPYSSMVPKVIVTKESDSTLRIKVQQAPGSLDIVGFEIAHDGWSSEHGYDPIEIDFNEKIGINMTAPDYEDLNPFEGTTFLPKYFSQNSSYYELKLDLDGDWSSLTEVDVTLLNVFDVALTYHVDL